MFVASFPIYLVPYSLNHAACRGYSAAACAAKEPWMFSTKKPLHGTSFLVSCALLGLLQSPPRQEWCHFESFGRSCELEAQPSRLLWRQSCTCFPSLTAVPGSLNNFMGRLGRALKPKMNGQKMKQQKHIHQVRAPEYFFLPSRSQNQAFALSVLTCWLFLSVMGPYFPEQHGKKQCQVCFQFRSYFG